jgi:hypothetical protein
MKFITTGNKDVCQMFVNHGCVPALIKQLNYPNIAEDTVADIFQSLGNI